jgi:hypothetical protein
MTKPTYPEWIERELGMTEVARARGTLSHEPGLKATGARYDPRKKLIVVELANGTSFAFPPSLAQGLADARAADLAKIELTPLGAGLHWPRLDADLTVEGLLAGMFGGRAWMRAHAARAGSTKSPATAAAARANGAKGGRPWRSGLVPV